jgi:hypothetical protein
MIELSAPSSPAAVLNDSLGRLCLAEFDPFFWPSSRRSVLSAWYGHVPFAHWLVSAAQPRVIVELGTHNGVSYAAFCEAILRSRLEARCFAVDTWQGDQHAGHYDERVYDEFREFHDPRYGAFSTLIRAKFDDAVESFADGSIDLLHIDGLHTYEAARHDFETWLPKMSERGVVLLHDIAVEAAGFGVTQLWSELEQCYPSFVFSHCNGLGILALGRSVAPVIRALCALPDPEAATVRARFEHLGEPESLRCVLAVTALTALQKPPAGDRRLGTGVAPAPPTQDAMRNAWCLEQVAAWLSRPMPYHDALIAFRRLNETNGGVFVFNVEHGTVTLTEKPEHARTELYDIGFLRASLYRSFLESAAQLCPEVVTSLVVFMGDGALAESEVPVFAFQKETGNYSLLLPDIDFLWNDFFDDAQFQDDLAYAQKRCSAVFAGSTTGGVITPEVLATLGLPRLRAAMFFRDNPDVDFRLPNLVQCDGPVTAALARAMGFGNGIRLSWQEQFQHRFIISMDGIGASCSRVAIALRSNSVLIKYASPHVLYYFSGLQPWRHYLTVSSDEELVFLVRTERERPGLFESVAVAGRQFAEAYLTRDSMMRYTADLLRLYSSVLTRPTA